VLLARDYTHKLAVISNLDETATQLDLHLEKAFTLSGTVLDADGRPIPDAEVELGMRVETVGQLGGWRQLKFSSDDYQFGGGLG
jgi:hypothetical protein